MRNIYLPYGKRFIFLEIPDQSIVTIVAPVDTPPSPDPLLVTRNALDKPIKNRKLVDFTGVKTAAIAINDKTRPVPHEYLLPPLLEKLHQMGISEGSVEFIVAMGTHKPMPADEYSRILPADIIKRYPISSHDCDATESLVNLGTTRKRTNVLVNRRFFNADLRIVVGNIEPHHFMGFSGGSKSASIGLTGRETINQNHSMLIHPDARIGVYDTNPMRNDVEEIGQMIGVQYAVNAILNLQKEIVEVVAGDPLEVMKVGIPLSLKICQTQVEEMFDLVIASVGGYPKDINLYQSQKAITHACLITKPGGIIILVGECPEGSGNQAFEQFMEDVSSYSEVEAKFLRQGFRVGPHKAFQLARQLNHAKVFIVSEMDPHLVKKLQLIPFSSITDAYHTALNQLPKDIRIAVMPAATNTIPSSKSDM